LKINNIVNGFINFIASIKPVHASVAWTIIWGFVKKLKNSVTSVRKRYILTERLPLVGEVNANFC
jgi:hypothetical protein